MRTDRFTTPTASASTYFLRHWVREASLLERGPAIRKLTLDAAALWGVRARGYDYTLVNGTVEHDELTGARPGRVVTPA